MIPFNSNISNMTKITEVTHFTATMIYVKLDARKLVTPSIVS